MRYQDLAKRHMARYKEEVLKISSPGTWGRASKPYGHILPPDQREMNLLPQYRVQLAEYIQQNGIHLHHNFHHLNSSQAACLNFFYPLMAENQVELLFEILGLEREVLLECAFEKIMPQQDGTNFDLYIRTASNKQLFFEIKYTEDGFGKVKDMPKYRDKFEKTYKDRLQGKLKENLSAYDTLIQNYQLLRNISYIASDRDDRLTIICPQQNLKLLTEFDYVLTQVTEPNLHPKLRLVTWEDIVNQLLLKLKSDSETTDKLAIHYEDFKRKYLGTPENGEAIK